MFEICLACGAHHHNFELGIVLDRGHDIVGPQHVLVQEIADRQLFGMVADRHHRDDLAAVEKDGKRPLVHDPRLHAPSFVIETDDRLGQSGIGRIGKQERVGHCTRSIRGLAIG